MILKLLHCAENNLCGFVVEQCFENKLTKISAFLSRENHYTKTTTVCLKIIFRYLIEDSSMYSQCKIKLSGIHV